MSSAPKRLIRGIGALGVGLIVLNSMMGAGIFALPAAVASATGAFSPWLFLCVGVLFMSTVLTFAELTAYFKDTGGPVLYTTTAFGPAVGFGTGWILYVSRVTAFAANVTVMAVYAAPFFPWLSEGAGRTLFITVVVGVLAVVNYVGVRDGVWALVAFSLLKLLPLVLIIIVGVGELDASVLPDTLPALSELGGVSLLIIYAFVGFESATVVSGEVKNPQQTLPFSLLATVAGVAGFYFLLVLVYTAVIPVDEQGASSLSDLGARLLGDWGGDLVAIAAIFSIGGNLAAILLAASRLTFSLGEQRYLPAWLAQVHRRFASPGNSVLLLAALGLAFALSGTFVVLAVASSLTRLLTYILCFAALPVIRRRWAQEGKLPSFRLMGGYTIPLIALLLCLWLITYSTLAAWAITGGMLAVGFSFYFLTRRDRAGR